MRTRERSTIQFRLAILSPQAGHAYVDVREMSAMEWFCLPEARSGEASTEWAGVAGAILVNPGLWMKNGSTLHPNLGRARRQLTNGAMAVSSIAHPASRITLMDIVANEPRCIGPVVLIPFAGVVESRGPWCDPASACIAHLAPRLPGFSYRDAIVARPGTYLIGSEMPFLRRPTSAEMAACSQSMLHDVDALDTVCDALGFFPEAMNAWPAEGRTARMYP